LGAILCVIVKSELNKKEKQKMKSVHFSALFFIGTMLNGFGALLFHFTGHTVEGYLLSVLMLVTLTIAIASLNNPID
jgi:hypothetical protein